MIQECEECAKVSPPLPRHHPWCRRARKRARDQWVKAHAYQVTTTPENARAAAYHTDRVNAGRWVRTWRWICAAMGRGIA